MKKIFILIVVFLLVTVAVCWNNISKYFNKSADIVFPEVTLKSTNQNLVPNYYEEGFDFNYDRLLELETSEKEDILIFHIPDNEVEKIEVSEDYYTYSNNSGVCEKNVYTLKRNIDGKFTLPVKRIDNSRDENGIYYLKIPKGVFVFKVNFKLL